MTILSLTHAFKSMITRGSNARMPHPSTKKRTCWVSLLFFLERKFCFATSSVFEIFLYPHIISRLIYFNSVADVNENNQIPYDCLPVVRLLWIYKLLNRKYTDFHIILNTVRLIMMKLWDFFYFELPSCLEAQLWAVSGLGKSQFLLRYHLFLKMQNGVKPPASDHPRRWA